MTLVPGGAPDAQAPYASRIGFDQACAIVDAVASARPLGRERVPVARCAGRVLATDVVAPIALPSFDNSAMDGFALRHADLNPDGPSRLHLAGEQFAGRALPLRVEPGQCVRITTGAPMPAGTDTIVIKENVQLDGAAVIVPPVVRPGAHVRYTGEDVAVGDRLLHAGQRLTPAAVGLAAALGCAELEVAQRPTVAVFTSGDELRRPGEPLATGEIYDSNRALLMALLVQAGLEPVAWPNLPDDPARIAAALADAASAFDVVITCGGVSAGEKDHLPAFVAARGTIHFWRVRLRPGMPVLLGTVERAHLLCLPGNPVSVLATFLTLGRRLLDGLQGRRAVDPPLFARLSVSLLKSHARLEFQRGRLQPQPDGTLQVAPNPATGSHHMAAAADSDVLIVIPEGPQQYAVGTPVQILPYA